MPGFYDELPEKLTLPCQADKRYFFAAWSHQDARAIVDISNVAHLDNTGESSIGLIPEPFVAQQEVGKGKRRCFMFKPKTTTNVDVTAKSLHPRNLDWMNCRPAKISLQIVGPFVARTWYFHREDTSDRDSKGHISVMAVELSGIPYVNVALIDEYIKGLVGNIAKFEWSTPMSPNPTQLTSDDRLLIKLDWKSKGYTREDKDHVIILATERLPEDGKTSDQVYIDTFLPYRKVVWASKEDHIHRSGPMGFSYVTPDFYPADPSTDVTETNAWKPAEDVKPNTLTLADAIANISNPTETGSSSVSNPTEANSSNSSIPAKPTSSNTSIPTDTAPSNSSIPAKPTSSDISKPTETAPSNPSQRIYSSGTYNPFDYYAPEKRVYTADRILPGITIAEADNYERVWFNTSTTSAVLKNPANGEGFFIVAANLTNGSQSCKPGAKIFADFPLAQAQMAVVTARIVGKDGKMGSGEEGFLWDVMLENSPLSITSVEPWYSGGW